MDIRAAARPSIWISLLILLIVMSGSEAHVKLSQSKVKRKALTARIAPEIQSMLDRISAESLRGHLSFIASDLLEGRNTPSRGLEIAAEYITAQFRRAGLEPVCDVDETGQKTFFQIAKWRVIEPDLDSFELSINDGSQTKKIGVGQVSLNS